ncbi:uncharacterized protein LOC111200755 [Brassica napus]|uniref:uncharacterized protein LOC111200755 n=1 Tax=Brassica napus TaxID=3708 RepID=UPI0020785661|nr:uncharacterized protein LOC111200755 [Brassica napus]
MVHLQLKDGPVINVYLWDEAAENFRVKFDACAETPTVLLVTTVNPKRLGGKLCLSSMSSSRVFLDEEVDPTKEYLAWLTTNPGATSSVNPVEVVKAETLTISEIAAFIKREPAKVAYFDCIATIDDVKHGTEWYYIACKDCQTKLNRGPTTLLCPKCDNENATAVANYRVEMSVYDNEEQCTFIILGDAGKELTGRKATELIVLYLPQPVFTHGQLYVGLSRVTTKSGLKIIQGKDQKIGRVKNIVYKEIYNGLPESISNDHPEQASRNLQQLPIP